MNIVKHDLKFNGELRKRNSTKFCIFHHTGGGWNTVEEIHEGQIAEHGWIGIGYNLIVYPDGSIHEGRPIWACDADAYGHNDDSLSACLIGDLNKEEPTEQQIKSSIEIIIWSRKEYPGIMALRHMDVNQTDCPGKNFPATIIYEGMKDMKEEHWAEKIYQELLSMGIVIHDRRFDDKPTRGEVMAMMLQILKNTQP